MGARFPSVFTAGAAGGSIVTTAETVLVSSPAFSPSLDGSPIFILWTGAITVGVGTTTVTYRLRQGVGVAGASVRAYTLVVDTAGQNAMRSAFTIDTTSTVAGIQYSLTAVQNGATANGTINAADILVFSL